MVGGAVPKVAFTDATVNPVGVVQPDQNATAEGSIGLYAIVEDQGQQYTLRKGDVLNLARRPARPGQQLDLERVLLLRDGDQLTVGQPLVPGVKVTAKVLEEIKDRKVIVFKYKSSVRYRRLTGHRQKYCRVQIIDIVRNGQ